MRTGLLMADALGLGKKSNKKVITALLSQPDVRGDRARQTDPVPVGNRGGQIWREVSFGM